jgi:DNA-binding transcriptional regulator GbsR (MarR family)
MKKIYFLIIVLIALSVSSCQSNMRRDVKRLSHKTIQCFSKYDPSSNDSEAFEEFEECYDEVEELMEQYDEKYNNEKDATEFGRMYLKELNKSDKIPQEYKELYQLLYSLGEDGIDDLYESND